MMSSDAAHEYPEGQDDVHVDSLMSYLASVAEHVQSTSFRGLFVSLSPATKHVTVANSDMLMVSSPCICIPSYARGLMCDSVLHFMSTRATDAGGVTKASSDTYKIPRSPKSSVPDVQVLVDSFPKRCMGIVSMRLFCKFIPSALVIPLNAFEES